MEPSIILENDSYIVVNKPAGLISHSDGRTIEPSLAQWLLGHFPDLSFVGTPWISPQGESVAIAGMVHRLDRTTSGVMVIAKNRDTWVYLKKEFKARQVFKKYRAIVHGSLSDSSGTIVAEIMRSSLPPRRWYARPCVPTDARAAISEWHVLQHIQEENDSATYIEVMPTTGRTHQIRVHCASIGHPLVGDKLYAPDAPALFGFSRPALHAYSIDFMQENGVGLHCVAPLPADFEKIVV